MENQYLLAASHLNSINVDRHLRAGNHLKIAIKILEKSKKTALDRIEIPRTAALPVMRWKTTKM